MAFYYSLRLYRAHWNINSINERINNQYKVNIHPNPSNSNTIFEFNLVHAGYLSISLYNSMGILVKNVINNSYFMPGQQKIEIITEDLPTGMYYVVQDIRSLDNFGSLNRLSKGFVVIR